ncbi:hypothetical protein ACQPZZ_19310 [Microbispora sp. CA-135349]|uniref:hypothetical protein n=1 Tax=Microbispora sp. CA-135349 TaxID=3239953 RepID=UPI003D8B4A8C
MAAEIGAGFAGPVAQGDDVIEPATAQRVQVAGPPVGDVDAVALAQHLYGVRVNSWSGPAV